MQCPCQYPFPQAMIAAMLGTIGITLPFFALIGCGYLAGRTKIIPRGGVEGLTAFVFYFALPALLFRSLALKPLGDVFEPDFMWAYALAGLSVYAVAAVMGRVLFRATLGEVALFGHSASIGNVGFLALPLVVAVLGEEARVPVILCLFIDLVVLLPVTIILLEASKHRNAALGDFARNVGRGVLINPFVLSIAAGVIASALGVRLADPVDLFTRLLGSAAGPAALFALGGSLGSSLAMRTAKDGGGGAVVYMTVFKLAVYPAVMWLVMTRIFEITPLWAAAAILTAAAPIAANVFVVAGAYDQNTERVSAAILVSTAAAVITFSALAGVLAV